MATSPKPTPAPPRGTTANAKHSPLIDTLASLRKAIKALPTTLAGSIGRNLGNLGSLAGSAAGSGLGSAQSLAQAVSRTMQATATSFAQSMQATTKTWKTNLAGSQAAWATSIGSFSKSFSQITGKASRGFQHFFDATIGRGINLAGQGFTASAKVAHKAWQDPVGFATGPAKAAWGFGTDFLSAWNHAQKGGLPVGGLGAVWGQSAALGLRNFFGRVRSGGRRVKSGLGRAARGLNRKGRYAWIRGTRAFKQTGSFSAALSAGTKGFAGAQLLKTLNNLRPVLSAIELFSKTVTKADQFSEQVNSNNRYLGHYSGRIGAAFTQLDLSDQLRDISLARATEGTASELARAVNQNRESKSGIDRLWAGVSNRAGIAAAGFAEVPLAVFGGVADQASQIMEKVDKDAYWTRFLWSPGFFVKESGLKGGWNWLQRQGAWVGGGAGSLVSGENLNDAWDAANRAAEEQKRLQNQPPPNQNDLDAWSRHILESKNLPPIRPGRMIGVKP